MTNTKLTQRRLDILRAYESPSNTASFVITGTFPMLGSGILFCVSDYSIATTFKNELNSLFPEFEDNEDVSPAQIITVDQAAGRIKDINKRFRSDTWVKDNLMELSVLLGGKIEDISLLLPHSHKAEQYKSFWEYNGVPYHFGLAMYLLSYVMLEASDRIAHEQSIEEWVLDMVLTKYHLFKMVERVSGKRK